MRVAELIQSRRTIRRFAPQPIAYDTLVELVDAGRLAPSARNLQPLAFLIIDDAALAARLFPLTMWAGYLANDAGRPPAGREPVAYIVLLIDRRIRPQGGEEDVGAAAENITLLALEKGIGSCWLGSVHKGQARTVLAIPESFELAAVMALGYPDESPVAEVSDETVKYYRDEAGRLHVPKRSRDAVLFHNRFQPPGGEGV